MFHRVFWLLQPYPLENITAWTNSCILSRISSWIITIKEKARKIMHRITILITSFFCSDDRRALMRKTICGIARWTSPGYFSSVTPLFSVFLRWRLRFHTTVPFRSLTIWSKSRWKNILCLVCFRIPTAQYRSKGRIHSRFLRRLHARAS